jgi:hypothetical protein
MNNIHKLIMLLIFGFSFIYGQESKVYSYEISGSVLYSYSYTVSPFDSNNSYFIRTHQLQFEPEFGYFIISSCELIAGINYNLSYLGSNTFISEQIGHYRKSTDQSQTHRIGLFVGGSYNLYINDMLTLFLGTKIGFSTTRYFSSYDDPNLSFENYDTHWTQIELTFPSFFCGTKLYFNSKWAIILKAQYLKTNHYRGHYQDDNDSVLFGLGISKLF